MEHTNTMEDTHTQESTQTREDRHTHEMHINESILSKEILEDQKELMNVFGNDNPLEHSASYDIPSGNGGHWIGNTGSGCGKNECV